MKEEEEEEEGRNNTLFTPVRKHIKPSASSVESKKRSKERTSEHTIFAAV